MLSSSLVRGLPAARWRPARKKREETGVSSREADSI